MTDEIHTTGLSGDRHRRVTVVASGEIEHPESVDNLAAAGVARGRDDPHRATLRVDNRRAEDAHLPFDVLVAAWADLRIGQRNGLSESTWPPKRRAGHFGIKGVDHIVHRRDEKDVADAATDVNAGRDQRLSVNCAHHRQLEHAAKSVCVNIVRTQARLVEVGTATAIVHMLGDDHLCGSTLSAWPRLAHAVENRSAGCMPEDKTGWHSGM